ncbi:MAG: ABC transporter permease [Prolixibacteraceae bacterium]|nr:ABC transporter permease [Prolixibacteraceae bacterium]
MKIILRNFKKDKASYITILLSLFIAFTAIFLIGGYVIHEYSVDAFHFNKNRIYRLQSDDPWSEGHIFDYITFSAPEYIKNNFPEVENYCQWNRNGYEKLEVNNNTFYKGLEIYQTQSSFFEMFSYPFKYGNAKQALNDKSSIVLSEETALKFFGNDNPIGQAIKVKFRNDEKTFTVSGVLQKPKNASHQSFDMLTSIDGKEMRGCKAYLMLKPNSNAQELENKLQQAKNEIPFFGIKDTTAKLYLQPLTEIHLTKEVKSKVVIFLIIAALILFVAFFNYINLFITQIQERSGELGIRRIIGGSFADINLKLVYEFSVLISIALLLSTAGLKLFLPIFNSFNESTLVMSDFIKWKAIASILLVSLAIGLISIPIVYSRIKKFLNRSMVRKPSYQIPFISTFQFAVSVSLIVCSLAIIKQIKYIHQKDIGLNRNIIEMRLPPIERNKSQLLLEKLRESPAIEQAALCSASPVREGAMVLYQYEKNGKKQEYSPLFFQGDESYIDILDIQLVEGRNFHEAESQNKNRCLINEAMVKFLELKDPVGSILPGSKNEVIGVVENFHWQGLEAQIPPAMIAYNNQGSNLLVKTNQQLNTQAIAYLQSSWNEIIQDYPLEYWTIGDLFNQKHKQHELLIKFISFFCVIAIFLTIIGGIARTALVVKNKTKEIGIRKVNGATISEVMIMLNSDFVKWTLIAIIIATPIAWYAMNKWLESFAYKTELSWWIFALAGLLALGIALLTVSFQSWKAATRNPVEALRYE